jgi:hypothetical protein
MVSGIGIRPINFLISALVASLSLGLLAGFFLRLRHKIVGGIIGGIFAGLTLVCFVLAAWTVVAMWSGDWP